MTGAELRTFRTSLNLDQAAFALRLGIAVEHLSRMERGHKPVGPAVERGVGLLEVLKELHGRTGGVAVKVRQIAQRSLGIEVEPDFVAAAVKAA